MSGWKDGDGRTNGKRQRDTDRQIDRGHKLNRRIEGELEVCTDG